MMRNIASVILVIVWMIVIFMMSSSDGITSSETSGKATEVVINLMSKVDETVTKDEVLKKNVAFIVRKLAHFTEYFILGFLLMNMMYCLDIRDKRIVLSLIIVILYAITDELHQVLVSGRVGNVADVLLDSSAGIIAIWFYHRFVMMRWNNEEVIY